MGRIVRLSRHGESLKLNFFLTDCQYSTPVRRKQARAVALLGIYQRRRRRHQASRSRQPYDNTISQNVSLSINKLRADLARNAIGCGLQEKKENCAPSGMTPLALSPQPAPPSSLTYLSSIHYATMTTVYDAGAIAEQAKCLTKFLAMYPA